MKNVMILNRCHPNGPLSNFLIAKYPVSIGEFREVIDGAIASSEEERYMKKATWTEAIRYCNLLNRKTDHPPAYDESTGLLIDQDGIPLEEFYDNRAGVKRFPVWKVRGFRLPTSEEWEYAAAGKGLVKSDLHLFILAKTFKPMDVDYKAYQDGCSELASMVVNPIGVFGMLGNPREWYSDNDIRGLRDESGIRNKQCSWDEYYTNYNNDISYSLSRRIFSDADRCGFRIVQTSTLPEKIISAEDYAATRSDTRRSENIPGSRNFLLGTDILLELLPIPSGSFLMGSPESELGRMADETRHPVTLTYRFWLGKFQVTQAQWQAVMGDNPSCFKGPDLPVEQVTWEDCAAFAAKLTEREKAHLPEGYGYRLPTEAEWEYACRSGTATPFHYGNTLDSTQANFDGNYPYGDAGRCVFLDRKTPGGTYRPNSWGLYDMHGNVAEWCHDWYADYPEGVAIDPVGPDTGQKRVLRGGHWRIDGRTCRSACRCSHKPNWQGRFCYFGFRLALAPKIEPAPA